MITIAHVLDDPGLGGVTRFLDALQSELGTAVQQSRIVVAPNALVPPSLTHDVVVMHATMGWAKLPFLLALRARRGRRPIILVEHSYSAAFERKYVPHPKRFRVMLQAAYRLVDHVVAVSYGQAAWMRRARLLPAGKLAVIAPFTTCEGLAALSLPVARTGPLRLGAYGRYCAQKDFQTLIAAMRQVDASVATLSVRGFGDDSALLLAEARGLAHVTVGGKIENLAEFLAELDAVAVPSRYEPFGQVALEARAAGRALIVTDVDGLPEQVEVEAGLIVAPEDARALADAIELLAVAKSDGRLPSMGAAGRETARHHAKISGQRWLALLAATMARRVQTLRPAAAELVESTR